MLEDNFYCTQCNALDPIKHKERIEELQKLVGMCIAGQEETGKITPTKAECLRKRCGFCYEMRFQEANYIYQAAHSFADVGIKDPGIEIKCQNKKLPGQ